MNSIQFIANTVDKALHSSVRYPSEQDHLDLDISTDGAVLLHQNLSLNLNPVDNSSKKTSNTMQQQLLDLASDSEIVARQDEASILLEHEKSKLLDQDSDYKEMIDEYSLFKLLLYIVMFLPNNLILKPFMFIVRIITFPFRLFFRLLFDCSASKNDNETLPPESSEPNATVEEHIQNTTSNLNITPPQTPKDAVSNTQDDDRRQSSASTISTIVEEDLEFEISDKSNDDLIKSPTEDLSTPATRRSSRMIRSSSSGFDKLTPLSPLKNASTASSITSSSEASRRVGYSRTKRFVFPKLLFNFDINNPPQMPMKTLVLDLDETLIHSLSRHNSSILTKNQGITLEIKVNNNSLPTLYRIYKRPFVDEFLNIVKHWFNLVCFTASIKEYADPVLDYLEEEVLSKDKASSTTTSPSKKLFSQRLYRNSCLFVEGKGYVKDLGVLVGNPTSQNNTAGSVSPELTPSAAPQTPKEREGSRSRSRSKNRNAVNDLSKVVIVDNSPVSYSFHKENGIMVEGWINDPDDMELMNLLPLLNSLRFTSDVRNVLSLKVGQSAFR